MVMVELVLVLEQPNFPPRYLILAQSGMLVIFLSQCHHIASPITLYWSSYYPVGAAGDSSFSFSDGDGKTGVGPSTTTFLPRKLIVGLMVEILCHLGVLIIYTLVTPTKIGPIIKYTGDGRTNLVLLVMVGVVLVFRQPTSPPIKMV